MALLDDIRNHLALLNPGQRERQGAVLLREAAAEIERLRSQPCPYVTGTVTHHCTLTPFTLNDAEREAIHWAVGDVADVTAVPEKTLRGLLDRTRQVTS